MNTPHTTWRRPVDGSSKYTKERCSTFPKARVVLLVLFLVSIYLEVRLYITGSIFVPSFFTLLILMPIVSAMYIKRIYRYEAIFVGQVLVVLSLTALLSPGFAYIDQKLLGLLQTTVSLVGGILLFRLLDDLPKVWVARILLVLSIGLLIGAFLEVAGPLREVSLSFREAAYGGPGDYAVYRNDERDLGITGFPRATVFTAEPSLLAIGFFVFINSWLILAYSGRNLAVACLLTLVMFISSGSPVLIMSIIVSLIVALFSKVRVGSFLSAIVIICIGTFGITWGQPQVFSNLFERFGSSYENIDTQQRTSENERLVYPYVTLVNVITESPFFGVGVSGKEVIERYERLPVDPKVALGNNVLAHFFSYLGLIGSLLFVLVFLEYCRRVGVNRIALLLILLVALSQMLGGFETPRLWGYTFLFVAVLKKSAEPLSTIRPLSSSVKKARDLLPEN